MEVIILDILLPNMDGFDVISHIREMESTRYIQILAITNLPEMENKVKGLELGADDYLIKPVNGHELRLRIKTLLKRKSYLDMLYEIKVNANRAQRLSLMMTRPSLASAV